MTVRPVLIAFIFCAHCISCHAAELGSYANRDEPRSPFGKVPNEPYLKSVQDLPIEQIKILHQQGKMDATIQLARLLWWEGDTETPIQLLQNPAKQGVPVAQYLLGTYLRLKKRDLSGSIKWLTKAAEASHPLAQETLAGDYEYGSNGLPKDLKHSYHLYHAAAEQGLKHSQLSVGVMLCTGMGVSPDKQEGAKWVYLSQGGQPEQFSPTDDGCDDL